MSSVTSNVFTRDDTFFGVCEALGEDLRINPIFLRLGFGVSLLFNPPLVVGLYAAAGMAVLVSRLIVPNPRRSAGPVQQLDAQPAEAASFNDNMTPLAAAA